MKFTDLPKTFKDEREMFIEEISEITVAHRTSVVRWLSGKVLPSKRRREIIAEHLNIPEETLFPETINQ